MNRSWWIKFWVLIFFFGTAIVHVYPTLANLNLETTKFPFKKKVNLGLDLQGGLYMVYGIDFARAYKEVLVRQSEILKNDLEKEQIALSIGSPSGDLEEDPTVLAEFPKTGVESVRKHLKNGLLRIVEEKANGFVLGLARDYRADLKDKTLNQSVQVIRNRIDEFGISEPSISTRGNNRVVVELPGVKDVERAKALVGRTARLEFKLVSKDMDPAAVGTLVSGIEKSNNITYKEGEKFSEYMDKVNAAAKGKLPEGTVVSFVRNGVSRAPVLLNSKVELTGGELADAGVSYDQQTNTPMVTFKLNPHGADSFAKVTEDNIGRQLAIILDDIVVSSPVIQGKIPGGSGQITLGGGGGQDVMKEARDLAVVLRAGALPAQLDLLEQRVIGPSLGQDSVKKGVTAGIVGCILVFIFMTVYYRASGMVAVVSLVLNLLFTFAILVGMDATLTLPGIAGLALTIGMAVDSNVIIFERIRDEILEGKTPAAAIHAGFDKAFSCIFDANITHGIVAIILLNFGSGPIKGFAVTLLIGIVTTLFCAVTVCKLVFDGYLARNNEQLSKLSI